MPRFMADMEPGSVTVGLEGRWASPGIDVPAPERAIDST